MSEHFRSLVTGLKKSVNRITNPTERQIQLPVDITLETERCNGNLLVHNAKPVTVKGCTKSMSKSGLSFVVPFIRVGEHYLVSHGEQKRLNLRLELPNGTIRMSVASECFEMIQLHDSVQQYLISVNIVQINQGDDERYQHFLKHGDKVIEKQSENTAELAAHSKKSLLSGFLSLF